MSEKDAFAEIEKYDINSHADGFAQSYRGLAVPYRRNDGATYVLLRVRDANGEAKDFKLSYQPDGKTVKYRGKVTDLKTFLAGQGLSPGRNEIYFVN